MVSKELQFNCKEVTTLLQVRFFIRVQALSSYRVSGIEGGGFRALHQPSNSISQSKTPPTWLRVGAFCMN